uniref:Immunoglobulin subtype domain-containing protein n=1 Tax=Erpetoichthys calabaricus TaxID=27687 RepID=A0A8C4ST17_ERPCA
MYLQNILLISFFFFCLLAEKCTASQKQEYLIQGSSGQDIILGHGLEVNSTVEIAWEFVTKDGKELVVAKANRQNVKVYTKFLDRVIVNNTHFLLTIKNLTYQDTGTYIGRLTYESGEIQSVSYKISIRGKDSYILNTFLCSSKVIKYDRVYKHFTYLCMKRFALSAIT